LRVDFTSNPTKVTENQHLKNSNKQKNTGFPPSFPASFPPYYVDFLPLNFEVLYIIGE